jgi:hypothetical protein
VNARGFIVMFAVVCLAPLARAADGGAAASEADTLARSIAESAESLATATGASAGECITACRAVGSMRRATERLCALEPGPRCNDARAALASAAEKVRAACPTCITAAPPLSAPLPAEAASTPASEPAANPSAQPPAERPSRGCAACAVLCGPVGNGEPSALFAAAAIFAFVARTKRRRDRTRWPGPRARRPGKEARD